MVAAKPQGGGKKRSAKEMGGGIRCWVVDSPAGGKRLKKGEGDDVGERKKAPPFVCDIFRRDVASFLPRKKIQQWRQTSRFSNAALSMYPSRLPRFKYRCLTVIFARADRCRLKRDGFLHQDSADTWMRGKEFGSIFKFRFCCGDVRSRARELLVGQRLFPGKPDDEGVAFLLDVYSRSKTVVCRVPNRLTRRTAPAMLHFLHHLSHQACFKSVEIFPGATVDAAECAFNPLVLRVLPVLRLRGVEFGSVSYQSELSALTVGMAAEMCVRFNRLAYRGHVGVEPDFPQLLDLIATGRHLGKRLELRGRISPEHIDAIVKHFAEDVRSLGGAIRGVRYEDFYNPDWVEVWPARCPKEAARANQWDDEFAAYRFHFTNAHSKEPFSLLLEKCLNEPDPYFFAFELMFGSA